MASTYAEKLKDPRWQKKRLLIMERDKWECQICGGKETTLVVHHKYYKKDKEPWEYKDGVLTTLCESCHKKEHELSIVYEKVLCNCLKFAGAFSSHIILIAGYIHKAIEGGNGLKAVLAIIALLSDDDAIEEFSKKQIKLQDGREI